MKQRCTKSTTTISNIHGKHTNEKRLLNFHSEVLAEREGFEPPVPCGTPVFKTGVFDHSTISPYK